MNVFPLIAFILVLVWLYYQDQSERLRVTWATWIVVLWAVIYGSRPVTEWFGVSGGGGNSESVDEGNPIEAMISGLFLFAGCITLFRRQIRWGIVLRQNAAIVVFYVFWWLSILWSDYPLITFKRLFKELGTIVMALVVLTELAPVEALKAIFVRAAYLCIPLSVILIRYFPEWGRAYVGYNKSEIMWVGMATHKNTLGVLAMVGAVFLLWDLLASWQNNARRVSQSLVASRVIILALCWYLLLSVDSVTSLLCAVIGSVLLLVLHLTNVRNHPRRLELFGGGFIVLVLMLDSLVNIKEDFLSAVGRDPTLTTRTEIWPMLMHLQPNDLVGAGYNTFWAGERLRISFEKFGGIFQAHNGYLETYLNGGWLGVGILACVLCVAYLQIRKRLVVGSREAGIRLVILIIAAVYNYSEASFNKIGVLWLLTIIVLMQNPPKVFPLSTTIRTNH